ncbi:unnamed protein product [Cochlearia groenlandica]
MDLELDDDIFFADITKQINLLITDEDELGLFRESYQQTSTTTTPSHNMMMYNEQNYNLIRESKGTGVFIPRCSQPRRRQHYYNNHQKKKSQDRFNSSFVPKQHHHHVHHDNKQESITLHHHHASTNTRRTYRDATSLFT